MDRTAVILSLKTIYKLLTSGDYPVYSDAVFSRRNRKGLTVLRFWQNVLIPEFRSGEYGRMIWREEENRTRFTSNLCNRVPLPFYEAYAMEIVEAVSTETVLRQCESFFEVLGRTKYDHEAFSLRMREYIKLLEEQDPVLPGHFFEFVRANYRFLFCYSQADPMFAQKIASWFLTILTLHALCGTAAGCRCTAALRSMPDVGISRILECWRSKDSEGKKIESIYKAFGRAPLPSHCFLGREKELFELAEAILAGGKLALTGPAGCGKTELLLQLVRECKTEGFYRVVAAESGAKGITPALQKLKKKAGTEAALQSGEALLALDDVMLVQEKELQELLQLAGPVVIALEADCPEGFREIRLGETEAG